MTFVDSRLRTLANRGSDTPKDFLCPSASAVSPSAISRNPSAAASRDAALAAPCEKQSSVEDRIGALFPAPPRFEGMRTAGSGRKRRLNFPSSPICSEPMATGPARNACRPGTNRWRLQRGHERNDESWEIRYLVNTFSIRVSFCARSLISVVFDSPS